MVAQGYTPEEGIDYDEVFALVARIKAIRLFFAYASFMGFIVYQMDINSALLYGTVDEEVYVDDIIFGSAKKSLCDEFEDKYVVEILKKFDFATVKTASTPIETNKALVKDEEAEVVDVHLYRSMIGSLMYLIASRPDIAFAVCACARFQVTPKTSHLHAVKRIFRYLKGQPKLGLWYPRDSPFDLEAFSDSDYARASLDRKSTTGGCQFLGKRLISWQCKKQTIVANSTTEAKYVVAANCCGQAVVISESSVRSDLLFNDEDGISCLTNDEIFENLALMGYEQLSTKLTFQKGGSPRRQETMGGALAQTRSERVLEKPNEPPLPEGHTSGNGEGSMEHTFELMDTVPPTPHDSPLTGGYTIRSDEGRLKLKDLMAICTKLSKQVLDLEKEKDAQAVEILKLKQRVKKLERRGNSDFDVYDDDMEDVEGEIVHTTTTRVSAVSAPVTTTGVAISTAEPRTPPTTAATALIDEDLTIAQTLIKMKEDIAKEKGVAIKDVEDSPRPIRSITTLQPLPTIDPKYKVKGVLVEEEPEKPRKSKNKGFKG
ncbi:ribonuclease H-like domain, reverse transcriptase, RNA-dependent DNA polymerase [Tanacetum coccineum]